LARDGSQANIALRGVGGEAGRLRPELRIVEGRMFGRGLHELIASRSAQGQFRGLRVGGHLDIRGEDWTIVGLFESGGDVHESELMADADAVLSTYHHTLFQSVTVQLQSAAALHGFKTYLKQNPMLSVDVRSEPEFFAWQSNGEIRLISALALIVGFIMALGAVFSALNTMYASLSALSVEIATLRAIGFGAGAVVISVFAEAFALAFAGAVIGTFAAWAFFDGVTIAALNPGSFTQLVFRMSLSPLLVFEGIAWAFVIALFGGLFPALRAARMPIAAGLRTLA
ncbi:MAG TPA: ABC transporter permease, partial [Rhizomicrobium sp.]